MSASSGACAATAADRLAMLSGGSSPLHTVNPLARKTLRFTRGGDCAPGAGASPATAAAEDRCGFALEAMLPEAPMPRAGGAEPTCVARDAEHVEMRGRASAPARPPAPGAAAGARAADADVDADAGVTAGDDADGAEVGPSASQALVDALRNVALALPATPPREAPDLETPG